MQLLVDADSLNPDHESYFAWGFLLFLFIGSLSNFHFLCNVKV